MDRTLRRSPRTTPLSLLLLALFGLLGACLLPAGLLRAQGRDLLIESIDFDGNTHIKGDRLKRVISVKEESSYPESAFDSAAFSVDMKKIVGLYVSEGFRGCRAEGIELDYNSDSTGADLTIRISEGPPTVVDTIVVTGNTFFARDELLDMLDFGRGDRYEREKATSGKIAIGTAYKTTGFLDVRVEVEAAWGSADDTCAVAYTVTEYTRFAVDSIRVTGLVDVKSHLLTREFRFAPGEFVDLDALATSQRLMYETNLFRTVSVRPVTPADSTSAKKDIQVRVTEEDPGKLELSFGFGSIDKVRAGALLSYNNTFGEGYRSSLGARFSAIEQTVSLSLDNPRMFLKTWGTSVVGTVTREDEPSYVIAYVNGQLNFYKKFLRRSRFSMTPSYEVGRYTELKYSIFETGGFYEDATPEEIEQVTAVLQDLRLGYDRWGLKGSVQLDLRDNLLDPTGGVYIDVSSEFIYGTMDITYQGTSVLPSTNRLLRSEAILRGYQALDRTTTIATSLETGVINDLADKEVNFLLNDLFYAGGPTSMRGFDYEKLGPVSSNGTPLGGMLKIVWNAFEIRKRIVGIFGAVGFLDIGNVWAKPEGFRWDQFRYTPGLGLRLDSPIGVVRFDYGFNPWPQNDEPPGQFWFGIGHAF